MKAPTHHIIGSNARTLQIITARSDLRLTANMRAGGSKAEMLALLQYAVKHWTELPHGREIEEAARRIHSGDLKLIPDDAQTVPDPSSTAARRRTGGEEVAVSLL